MTVRYNFTEKMKTSSQDRTQKKDLGDEGEQLGSQTSKS